MHDVTYDGAIWLKVPFRRKEEAKRLGALWNPQNRHWYLPASATQSQITEAEDLGFLESPGGNSK